MLRLNARPYLSALLTFAIASACAPAFASGEIVSWGDTEAYPVTPPADTPFSRVKDRAVSII